MLGVVSGQFACLLQTIGCRKWNRADGISKTKLTMLVIIPAWADKFPELIVGQTTRSGGVSPYPEAALNLGLYTDDAPENIMENRQRLAAHLSIAPEQFTGGRQVHGNEVKVVNTVGTYDEYDAFITNRIGVVLSVTTADCLPVLIFDSRQKAWGAAHAGWRGTTGEIAGRMLQQMVDTFRTNPRDCFAFIAAGISHSYFEVSEDVAVQFPENVVTFGYPNHKCHVDLSRANADQLLALGLPPEQIEISNECTVANNDRFFSHRHESGQTGRMLGLIGLNG